jgi:hypothetical protein
MAMKQATIREVGVTAEQLETYLKSTGWFEDGKIRNVASIWHRNEPEQEDAEILLPIGSVKDYSNRVQVALIAIATFENVTVDEILGNVKTLFSNFISVRVVHPDTADGTIPINDGVLLISKTKDLLLAAAHSLKSKKKSFSGKLAAEVRMYLDSLLLGQTEVGSYVVNVIAPEQNTKEDADTENLEVVESTALSKAITQNLVSSLQALKDASSEFEVRGKLSAFEGAVRAGASANMCDALLGLSGERRARKFEVSVTTARGSLFASETSKFRFDEEDVQILEKARQYYKEDYTLKEKLLIGTIQKLSRPRGEKGGTVAMLAEVDGVQRNVQIELEGDDYHLAVIAHDDSEYVRIQGDVQIKSKKAYLVNPVGFGAIRQDDLIKPLTE